MLTWIDLETTGLDPAECLILEVGCIVTDDDFEEVARYHAVCSHAIDMESVSNYVLDMHSKNGLWNDVSDATKTQEDVGEELLDFLKEHTGKRFAPLAGSSVHFDRKFLSHHWPDVDAWLHYRNLDVSSVKELIRRVYGEDALYHSTENKAHRTLADLAHSIQELHYYKKNFLVQP